MSRAVDINRVAAYVHYEPCKERPSTWLIKFYNINSVSPNNSFSIRDTVSGFFVPSEYNELTFGGFVQLLTKKSFSQGTLGILKFERLEYENFMFKEAAMLDQVFISTEPVLIDPDYESNLFCAQFCWVGIDSDMLLKPLPRFVYSLELKEPMFPLALERACPYTAPILSTMRPEDVEEFYNGIFYNQVLVIDFILVRASSDAAGYDIELGKVLDNTKDFDCPGEFNDACKTQFVVRSKYSYDLILPYFYANSFEMNGRAGDFMLRSSMSRRGITLSWTTLEDKTDASKGQSVQLTIHNQNNFDVCFKRDADKQCATEFPWRFLQFVPSMEFQFYLNRLNPDERANFLGVTLVQNDKARKDKI